MCSAGASTCSPPGCHGPGLQVDVVAAAYEQMAFSDAAAAIQKLSARGNLFMEEQAPWTAFKKASCHACEGLSPTAELDWHVTAFRQTEFNMQNTLLLLQHPNKAAATATSRML